MLKREEMLKEIYNNLQTRQLEAVIFGNDEEGYEVDYRMDDHFAEPEIEQQIVATVNLKPEYWRETLEEWDIEKVEDADEDIIEEFIDNVLEPYIDWKMEERA